MELRPGLDPLAVSKVAVQCAVVRTIIRAIIFPKQRSDSVRSFLCAIVWNSRKEVMDDMKVDDVMHKMSQDEAGVAIHGTERASQICPRFRRELGQVRRRVMKVGD